MRLESELFGYEKGAFTGAYTLKPGRVEAARLGTLFLDEIAELELGLQAKLLQLLQDGTYSRIGGQQEKRIEVRIISATNRDLGMEVERGQFRQDLFHRINGMIIRMPALRERLEDIADIGNYLLSLCNRLFKTSAPPLSSRFLKRLRQHHWPGNIRELENVIRRYAILGGDTDIANELSMETAPQLYLNIPSEGKVQLRTLTEQAIRQIEKQVIRTVLARNNGNRKVTAGALGISYRMLLYKLRDMQMPSLRRRNLVNPLGPN